MAFNMDCFEVASKRVDKFKLVIQRGEHRGVEFPLSTGTLVLGRWDPESGSFPDINLDNIDEEARVSRRHAQILVQSGRVVLEDLNSLNGTFVNRGDRLAPGVRCSLQLNDEIILGKVVFRLVADED